MAQKKSQSPHHQNNQPGIEALMVPQPEYYSPSYKSNSKLKNKTAVEIAILTALLPVHLPQGQFGHL